MIEFESRGALRDQNIPVGLEQPNVRIRLDLVYELGWRCTGRTANQKDVPAVHRGKNRHSMATSDSIECRRCAAEDKLILGCAARWQREEKGDQPEPGQKFTLHFDLHLLTSTGCFTLSSHFYVLAWLRRRAYPRLCGFRRCAEWIPLALVIPEGRCACTSARCASRPNARRLMSHFDVLQGFSLWQQGQGTLRLAATQ